MEQQEIIDQLDDLHMLLSKSPMDPKDYKKASEILLNLKQEIRKNNITDYSPLVEHCENYRHGHCDCIGKYCMQERKY